MDVVGKETLETMAFAKWYNKWLYELMEDHIGDDLLEIGAGTGNFTDLLVNGRRVTAVDIQSGYIERLKKKKDKRLTVGYGDIEEGNYFFKNKKFDTAIALNVFEHIKDDDSAIENTYDLLNDNGRFILLVPAHKFLYSKMDKKLGHHRRYSKNLVRKKLENKGFKLLEIRYLNWWAAIGWFVFLKINKAEKLPEDKVKIFDKLGKLFLLPEKYIDPPFGLSVFAIAKR